METAPYSVGQVQHDQKIASKNVIFGFLKVWLANNMKGNCWLWIRTLKLPLHLAVSEVKVLSPCAGRVLVVRGPGRVPAQAGLTTGRRYRAGLSRAASPGVSVSTADIYTRSRYIYISTHLHSDTSACAPRQPQGRPTPQLQKHNK